MSAEMIAAVKAALDRGTPLRAICHGRDDRGRSAPRLYMVDHRTLKRTCKENTEFGRFVAEMIVLTKARGLELAALRRR